MKQIIFTILFSFTALSQLPEIYTTRLLSTGGAGVASILANESSVLNPASIAFLDVKNFYYQKDSTKIENPISRASNSGNGTNQLYSISDTSSSVKGTFSYQTTARLGLSKKSFVSSLASRIGRKTSLGFIYKYNKYRDSFDNKSKDHELRIGLTYIHSKTITFGATYDDPFKSTDRNSILSLGTQFRIFSTLIFVQDFSFSTRLSYSETFATRSAIQLSVFEDFYLRAGYFKDKYNSSKGQSYGISWIGPKLCLEYAMMSSTFTENTLLFNRDEKDIISSFSVSVKY